MPTIFSKCDNCNNILCVVHKDMALIYGDGWPYIKCDQCYWNNST